MVAGYTVVPAAERLTLAGVMADATPVVQVVMGLLIVAVLGSIVSWVISTAKVQRGEDAGPALWRLKVVRSAGVMLGLLGASYTLLNSFIGLSNVRPTPTLTVMA